MRHAELPCQPRRPVCLPACAEAGPVHGRRAAPHLHPLLSPCFWGAARRCPWVSELPPVCTLLPGGMLAALHPFLHSLQQLKKGQCRRAGRRRAGPPLQPKPLCLPNSRRCPSQTASSKASPQARPPGSPGRVPDTCDAAPCQQGPLRSPAHGGAPTLRRRMHACSITKLLFAVPACSPAGLFVHLPICHQQPVVSAGLGSMLRAPVACPASSAAASWLQLASAAPPILCRTTTLIIPTPPPSPPQRKRDVHLPGAPL